MNASLPDTSQLREAIAAILASHSLDELNYDEVYTILQANFVRDLAPISQEIKKQLEILLFDSFLNEAKAIPSPSRNGGVCMPSPERPKEKNRAPIKKLLISRISDFKKKRSVDLSAVVESMSALGEDARFPANSLIWGGDHDGEQQQQQEQEGGGEGGDDDEDDRTRIRRGGGIGWISSGLFPQLIRIQFRCPVSVEKVIIEGLYLEKVRIESQQMENGLGSGYGGGSGGYYQQSDPAAGYDYDYNSSSYQSPSSSPSRPPRHRKASSSSTIEVDCLHADTGGLGHRLMMMQEDAATDWGEEEAAVAPCYELTEIKMDYRFTCCLLLILQGYRDFVVIKRLSLYGIAIELFQ